MDQLFDFTVVIDHLDQILLGFWGTVRLAVVTAVLSTILGTVLVAFRVSPTPVLRATGTFMVNVLRNTPLTLVALLCVLGISDTLKVTFSDDPANNGFWWAVTALSVYTS